MTFRPWSEAAQEALYGPDGFFVRSTPADHFRTSVTSSPLFAAAVRRLAGLVDEALGCPDPYDVVDVGAGRGELLCALPDVPARWRLTAVERAPDPGAGVHWLPHVPRLTGLLFANEWLDNVPLEVIEDDRLVLVDETGRERPGPRAAAELRAWAGRWWPGGGRVEVGLSRDRAWAAAVAQVSRGVAVAVAYGHLLDERRPTLTGYRSGRQVRPVPDGSCDLTAHVALDSCAAATGSALVAQRTALRALGVRGGLPSYDGDPPAYPVALAAASQAGTLLDPYGLGGFSWLVRSVDIEPGLWEGIGTPTANF